MAIERHRFRQESEPSEKRKVVADTPTDVLVGAGLDIDAAKEDFDLVLFAFFGVDLIAKGFPPVTT